MSLNVYRVHALNGADTFSIQPVPSRHGEALSATVMVIKPGEFQVLRTDALVFHQKQ